MAAKLVKTSTPGIYRRHATTCHRNGRCDCPYVVVHNGKARTFGTMDEAREGKRIAHRQAKLSKAHAAGLHRDEPRDECPDCERERQAREGAEPLLHDYAREVIARYIGTGPTGLPRGNPRRGPATPGAVRAGVLRPRRKAARCRPDADRRVHRLALPAAEQARRNAGRPLGAKRAEARADRARHRQA